MNCLIPEGIELETFDGIHKRVFKYPWVKFSQWTKSERRISLLLLRVVIIGPQIIFMMNHAYFMVVHVLNSTHGFDATHVCSTGC